MGRNKRKLIRQARRLERQNNLSPQQKERRAKIKALLKRVGIFIGKEVKEVITEAIPGTIDDKIAGKIEKKVKARRQRKSTAKPKTRKKATKK